MSCTTRGTGFCCRHEASCKARLHNQHRHEAQFDSWPDAGSVPAGMSLPRFSGTYGPPLLMPPSQPPSRRQHEPCCSPLASWFSRQHHRSPCGRSPWMMFKAAVHLAAAAAAAAAAAGKGLTAQAAGAWGRQRMLVLPLPWVIFRWSCCSMC